MTITDFFKKFFQSKNDFDNVGNLDSEDNNSDTYSTDEESTEDENLNGFDSDDSSSDGGDSGDAD